MRRVKSRRPLSWWSFFGRDNFRFRNQSKNPFSPSCSLPGDIQNETDRPPSLKNLGRASGLLFRDPSKAPPRPSASPLKTPSHAPLRPPPMPGILFNIKIHFDEAPVSGAPWPAPSPCQTNRQSPPSVYSTPKTGLRVSALGKTSRSCLSSPSTMVSEMYCLRINFLQSQPAPILD